MAENIKIGITVDDGGSTSKVTNANKLLRKEVDGVTDSAVKASAALKSTSAPKAAMAGYKTTDAIKTASQSPQESIEYGQARAAVGTGAAGRDFAKQAQGLGGLVHVYATFAANLFAVSAAFTALKDAASTTNIIEGLDQLGAASGRNLGTLAKQLSAASDGAISLRDSMTAVAQASSGGLANKQILQLGDVAKKASQALGLSMPDALSRLSRGITKIEPELLDELGIFVKVDEASQKYALSIGKTAASLSDFEKRQAFANAVLEQGTTKFGDIKIDANPFDKLLASMTNVATAGLQLVNKVLGPIASILSESPGALAAVFGLIGATLLKQSIPALSQWRNELTKSAEAAAASSKRSYEAFSEYSVVKAIARELKQIGPLQEQINTKISDAQTALAKTLSSKSKILAQAMSGIAEPEAMQKSLATELKRRETILSNLEATKDAEKKAGTATTDRLAAYDELAKKQHQDIINIKTASDAYVSAAKVQNDITKIQGKSDTVGIEENIRKLIAERAKNIAVSKGILAQVGIDTETKGTSRAFSNLFENIKKGIPVFDEFGQAVKDQDGKIVRATAGLTGFRAATTALSGSFLIVGDSIGKGLSAISPYLQLFALAVAAYELFNSYASRAAKEQAEFNSKISEGEAAIKTVNNTFDTYVRKTKNAFTIEGISAFTTALVGVTDALDSQILTYNKFKEVAGVFDNLKDSMAGFFFFTESNLEKLQKSTVDSVKAVVKSLELSGKSDSAKGIIAEALFGKDASIDKLYGNAKELNKAFDGLTESQREEKIKQISKAIDAVTVSEQYSTNAANGFAESLRSVDKLVDQIIQANAFTDLQGKLGVDLVLAAERLAQALSDPVKSLAALAKLGSDPKALAALGTVDITQLQQAVVLQKQLNDAEKVRADAISQQQKAIAGAGKLATARKEATSGFSFGDLGGSRDIGGKDKAIKTDIEEADKLVKKTNSQFEDLKKQAADFSLSQINLVTKISEAGFDKIEIGLKKAKELAALSVAKTAAGIAASGGANVADRNYNIKISELKIQETLINANYAVQLASIENSQKLDELNVTLQLATAAQLKRSDSSEDKIAGEALFAQASQRNQIIGLANLMKKPRGEEYTMAMRSATPEILGAAKARSNETLMAKKQAEAAQAAVIGQMDEAKLTRDAERRTESVKTTKSLLDLDNERLNTQNETLNLAGKILGYESALLVVEKQSVQEQLIQNDTKIKLAEIEKDRQNAIVLGNTEEINTANARAKARTKEVIDAASVKIYATQITEIQQLGVAIQGDLNRASAVNLEKLKLTNSVREAELSNLQAELGFKQQLGLIDEKTANAQKAQYDTQLLKLKSTEEEARIKADIAQKEVTLRGAKTLTALTFFEGSPAAAEAASTNQANAQSALDLAKEQLRVQGERTRLQTTAIDQAKTYNDRLIEQKDHLASIASLTENLSVIFGDLGKSMGGVVSAFDNLSTNEKKRADQLKEFKGSEQDLTKLKSKQAKAELDDQSKLSGAAKKLFSEKTTAYKTLDGLEKIRSAQSVAISIKEFAIKSGLLKEEQFVELAASAKSLALRASTALQSIGIDIPAIYAKYMAMMGPFGIPVATAAIAAFIGGAFSGGKGSAPPSGFTAEEQQKVQGTGQSYVGGKLVDNGGGVLGDPTALAKSITTALDTLSKEYFGGMGSGSTKIVNALLDIKENTSQTVKALLGKLTGFGGTNSAFNTTEGSSKLLGGLLGSSSTTISDAGITITGTIDTLKQGLGSLKQYENIVSKSSGLFGLFSSTSNNTKVKGLAEDNQAAVDAITNVFRSVSTVLVESGKALEGSGTRVEDMLTSIPVDIRLSVKGLTGQAAADALMAQISVALNKAALDTFPYIQQYRKIGEEMYDTVARIVKESETLNISLAMIGKTLVGANAEITTEMQQDLIKKAGGIEKLSAGLESYYNNFLTATDRYNVSFGSLNKKFTEANVLFPKSKAAYKEMVEGLKDLTDPKSRETLAFLLTNAEAYTTLLSDQSSALSETVSNLESSIAKFRDFSKSMKDFRNSLLLSASSTATPMEKYVEAKSQFDSTYALALSGDKDAMGKLTSISQTFLDLSKTMFASSDKYTEDFNLILEKINTASISAAASADVEQLKLDYAKNTVDLLSTINDNIATLVGIPGHAQGGYASGWAMVGERGPEMVNFSSPAQVYTADQTAGMFSPGAGMGAAVGAMVVEIQQLCQEVAQLRKDQQKQTGDIIISNYDANQKASEDIATAVASTSQDAAWTARSKSEIK